MKRLLWLRLTVEGLYPEGAAARLEREGIPLYLVQKINKNRIELCIERKYRKKAFTNLRGSCYNIIGEEYYGVYRLLKTMGKRLGLLLGAGMFFILCTVASMPILRIDVVGNGAFYRGKIEGILSRNRIAEGGLYDEKKAPLVTAEILALPDVFFCSLRKSGNILRIEVQAKTPTAPLCERGKKLYATHAGKVQNITLLRGMPKVTVGDEVQEGALLAEAESENSVLMASVTLIVTLEGEVRATSESEAVVLLKFGHGMGEEGKEVARKVKKQSTGEFLVSLQIEVTYRENM